MRKLLLLGLAAALIAVAFSITAAQAKTPTYKVGIYDNYFSPKKKTLTAGTKVIWTWKQGGAYGEGHNVTLTSAPNGIKLTKYSSNTLTTGTFARTLKTAGKYVFYCTLHPDMKLTVTVKAPK